MGIRSKIRKRIFELNGIEEKAKENNDKATMIEMEIRKHELKLLLSWLKK